MSFRSQWPVMVAISLLAACGAGESGTLDPAAHEAEVAEWRAYRLERLKRPLGFLNLAGLYWLEPGTSTFGSAPDSDVVFPDTAAQTIGRLHVTEAGVALQVEDGVEVLFEEIPVHSLFLSDDTTDNPVTVTHGTFAWRVIKRDERFAIRLWDYENPAAKNFAPLEYFPVDGGWRVNATFNAYDEPKIAEVETVIEGLGWNPVSPGTVTFTVDGEEYELEAYESDDELFFVFGDRTNGRTTYPAGRFLYSDLPDEDGNVVLDFNRSYSPPCAFNAFSTCPVASPRNRLPFELAAGEMFDRSTATF